MARLRQHLCHPGPEDRSRVTATSANIGGCRPRSALCLCVSEGGLRLTKAWPVSSDSCAESSTKCGHGPGCLFCKVLPAGRCVRRGPVRAGAPRWCSRVYVFGGWTLRVSARLGRPPPRSALRAPSAIRFGPGGLRRHLARADLHRWPAGRASSVETAVAGPSGVCVCGGWSQAGPADASQARLLRAWGSGQQGCTVGAPPPASLAAGRRRRPALAPPRNKCQAPRLPGRKPRICSLPKR